MNFGVFSGRIMAMAALTLCTTGVFAGEATVTDAWAHATAPGQDSAAVSVHIKVRQDARLVAVSSPAAERVEIHIMKHDSDMMMMRQVEDLALPANQEVVLGSGSHLMLVGLKQQLKPGDHIRLALTMEYADKRRETITVSAEVRPLASGHPADDKAGHGMDEHDMGGHDMGRHGY